MSPRAGLVPRASLLVALALFPLVPRPFEAAPLRVSPGEFFILLAAASGVALWAARRTPRPSMTTFDRPMSLFMSSALLSLLVTEYWRLSLHELRTLVLVPLLAYFLLVQWFSGRAVGWPLSAFLAGTVGVALAGLVGSLFGWGITEADGVRRVAASYPSANHLGLVLGRALPWLAALAWLGGRWRRPALAGGAVVGLALVLTFSRGAWIGVTAGLVVVGWALGGRRLLFLAGAPAAVVAAVAVVALRGRETAVFRLSLWQSSLAMLRDHPLLGVGLDNFLYLYQQRYIRPEALAESNLSHPHNLLLQFWLQLGLLGLVAALWLLWRALRLAATLCRSSNERWVRALAAGAAGSLADFVVHGMIDNSYFLPDLAVVFWLTLAVLECARPERLQLRVLARRPDSEWH